jgi:hypothetical protein
VPRFLDVLSAVVGILTILWVLLEFRTTRAILLLIIQGRYETLWLWFRWVSWNWRVGWWINARTYRRLFLPFNWKRDKKLIERELHDDEGNVAKIKVMRFSEGDIRARMKFLSEPVSSEEGRRGRSSRGRDQSIQIQRLRQFNFEAGLKEWPFVFPDQEWDEGLMRYVDHPQAGQPVPLKREYITEMDARISEQIDAILSEINEPPAELPEVVDEEGNVVEEAQESPLVLN